METFLKTKLMESRHAVIKQKHRYDALVKEIAELEALNKDATSHQLDAPAYGFDTTTEKGLEYIQDVDNGWPIVERVRHDLQALKNEAGEINTTIYSERQNEREILSMLETVKRWKK